MSVCIDPDPRREAYESKMKWFMNEASVLERVKKEGREEGRAESCVE